MFFIIPQNCLNAKLVGCVFPIFEPPPGDKEKNVKTWYLSKFARINLFKLIYRFHYFPKDCKYKDKV